MIVTSRRCSIACLLGIVVLYLSQLAFAEPMAAPGDKTKAQQLKLAEITGQPGLWHKKQLTLSGNTEQRFFVRGLNPAAPLSVQLITEDITLPVNVSLHRLSWINADYQAALQQGLFRFDGRAYGDVGIRIQPQTNSNSNSKATLLLWQGEPVVKPLVSFYQPPTATATHKGNTTDNVKSATQWWHIAVVVLLLVIVVLLVKLLRKPAALGAMFAISVAASGLLTTPPLTAQDKDDKPSPDSSPEADYQQRIAAAEQHVQALSEQIAANRTELEQLRLLLEQDRHNEPDADNFPPLPLSCKPPQIDGDGLVRDGDAQWENFERCQQCYAQPLQDLENQLLLYEKLRVYYRSTKDYVNNVITLGDKAPKPHSLIENAWAAQKYAINHSFSQTKAAYDNKLPELSAKLSSILDRIGQCETDFNNNPMWRQTSGLFFYNTMATSYKRSD